MYLKKKLVFVLAIVTYLILVSCETSTNYQTKSNVTNKQIKIDTQKKINSNISSITSQETQGIGQSETLNVGLMLPLSGEHYQIGQSLLNSAQLAITKTGNKKIVFHLVDTGNDEKLLTDIYELLEQDMNIFIGPIFSNKVRQIKEIIKDKNIPIISLSNNSNLKDKGLYIFGLTLEDEINELLNFSYQNNLKKYAVILPKNEFGIRVEKELNKFKSVNDLSSFKFIFYNTNSPDFYAVSKNISNYEERKMNLENKIKSLEKENSEIAKKELKKLKKLDTYGELNFEAIIIFAQNFKEVSNFSTILPYYDVDPKKIQFIGNSVWYKSQALKEPGMANGYFTSLDLKNRKIFEESYISVFDSKPHALATLTYDIVGLISSLHNEENSFTVNKLYNSQGFVGIDGWFKILPDGKVLRKPKIYRINNKNFNLLN